MRSRKLFVALLKKITEAWSESFGESDRIMQAFKYYQKHKSSYKLKFIGARPLQKETPRKA